MGIGKDLGNSFEKPKEIVNTVDFDPNKRIEQFKEVNVETINDVFDPDSRLLDIQDLMKNYLDDLKERIDFPELIDGFKIDFNNLEICTSEKISELRKEFNSNRTNLRKEWVKENNQEWPRYTENVYDKNGNLIRLKGDCYDAHHIKPLFLGGKNEVSNIVPIHALEHYDHIGVHDSNAPLSKIKNMMEGD